MPTTRAALGAAMRPPCPFPRPSGNCSFLREDLVAERRARLVIDELDVPAGRLLAVDREHRVVHALQADQVAVLGVGDRAEGLEVGLPQPLRAFRSKATMAHPLLM